jgi:hypothetical protein
MKLVSLGRLLGMLLLPVDLEGGLTLLGRRGGLGVPPPPIKTISLL